MSASLRLADKVESDMKSPARAESPTTVKPFDMDDDDVPDSDLIEGNIPNVDKLVSIEDKAPTKPSRPLSPQEQAENTLKEAFPSIDSAVVKAVLRASSGQIEPAFNALLGMSDPEASQELSLPLRPSDSNISAGIGSTPLAQLEADEQYARQLAGIYGNTIGEDLTRPTRSKSRGDLAVETNRPLIQHEERSFLEDELPILKDNLKRGLLETQNKVSGWINILKKKIDGESDEDNAPRSNESSSRSHRFTHEGRIKSDDYSPYDADPQELGDDFAGIQLYSDGTLASPSNKIDKVQVKPISASPRTSYVHQTPLGSDTQMENPINSASIKPDFNIPPRKQSKWQPLSTIDPSPTKETDHDPFSLGDTDDEKEVKDRCIGIEGKTNIAEPSADMANIAPTKNISNNTVKRDHDSIGMSVIE